MNNGFYKIENAYFQTKIFPILDLIYCLIPLKKSTKFSSINSNGFLYKLVSETHSSLNDLTLALPHVALSPQKCLVWPNSAAVLASNAIAENKPSI